MCVRLRLNDEPNALGLVLAGGYCSCCVRAASFSYQETEAKITALSNPEPSRDGSDNTEKTGLTIRLPLTRINNQRRRFSFLLCQIQFIYVSPFHPKV